MRPTASGSVRRPPASGSWPFAPPRPGADRASRAQDPTGSARRSDPPARTDGQSRPAARARTPFAPSPFARKDVRRSRRIISLNHSRSSRSLRQRTPGTYERVRGAVPCTSISYRSTAKRIPARLDSGSEPQKRPLISMRTASPFDRVDLELDHRHTGPPDCGEQPAGIVAEERIDRRAHAVRAAAAGQRELVKSPMLKRLEDLAVPCEHLDTHAVPAAILLEHDRARRKTPGHLAAQFLLVERVEHLQAVVSRPGPHARRHRLADDGKRQGAGVTIEVPARRRPRRSPDRERRRAAPAPASCSCRVTSCSLSNGSVATAQRRLSRVRFVDTGTTVRSVTGMTSSQRMRPIAVSSHSTNAAGFAAGSGYSSHCAANRLAKASASGRAAATVTRTPARPSDRTMSSACTLSPSRTRTCPRRATFDTCWPATRVRSRCS